MTPERWQQIDQLFHEALARETAERAAFLDKACAGDEPLRAEIESLISSHDESQSFIETPARDVAAELIGTHQSTFSPGAEIGNYRIVGHLGSGGMGEVYLAYDTRLNRKVALKLLPPHFTINPDRVRRFEREARAASALNHPNIVTIYEIGNLNSAHFIATEFVDGKTLRQMINEKPLKLSETLNVAIQIAGALTAAHAAQIVHRDIKPENIMIRGDGYAKILDFGLAKLTETPTTSPELETPTLLQSKPGLIMGTVQYMSPEQARGKKVDARTDTWSLGIVLYELLAGKVPFSGETSSHVMVSLMEDEPPPLTNRSNVPAELDRIVRKALRKNEKERYQTANHLMRDLKNLKEELQVETRLKGLLEAVPSSDGRTSKNDQQLGPQASSVVATTTETDALHSEQTHTRPTSTEYLISEIGRRKRVFSIAAALLTVAVVAVGYIFFTENRFAVTGSGTTNVPSALPEIGNYWLELERTNQNQSARVAGMVPMASGQMFKIHLNFSEDGYVYLIGPGSATNQPTAFLTSMPHEFWSGLTTNQFKRGSDFSFPSGPNWLRLEKNPGPDTFKVIFSKTPLTSPAFLNQAVTFEPLTPPQLTELNQLEAKFKDSKTVVELDAANSNAPVMRIKAPPNQLNNPIVFDIRIQHN